MVTPYKYPADAHLFFEKKAPVTVKDLTDDDIRILRNKKLGKDDYKKLSDNAITYMMNKEKEAKTERAKDVFQKEEVEPSTTSKVAEYGLDALSRGLEEFRERTIEGPTITGGLEKLFATDPHIPPIPPASDYFGDQDPERNRLGPLGFDIKERATGAGEAALAPLLDLFAVGGGIIESAHPPPLPKDDPRAELYNKWRDRSKLIGEVLAPIVPGFAKSKHAYGKAEKFRPNEELYNLLGGKITADEKRFIEKFTEFWMKEGKRPTNQEIADMVKAVKRGEGKVEDGRFVATHETPPDIPSDPSDITGFTKGELAKVQATDIEIAHYLNFAQELRNAGIGSDTFFQSTLGLRGVPKGIRLPPEKGFWDKVASWRATSMTSGIMTSIRNAQVSGNVFGMKAVDMALRDTIRKVFNKNSITNDELIASWLYLVDLFKSAKPAKMSIFGQKLWDSNAGDQIHRILRANRPMVEKFMALSRTSAEVRVLNRAQAIMSVLNNTQEYYLRKLAIEVSLRHSSRSRGLRFEDRMPKDFSEEELIKAFDHAFEITMAKSGGKKALGSSGKVVNSQLDNLEQAAWFKILVHSFPRFIFRNMLPWIRDYSQFGYLKSVNPKVMKKLLEGDPEEFAIHASKAYTGAMVLGWAMAMRSSEQVSTRPTAGGLQKRNKYFEWTQYDAQGNFVTPDLRVLSPTLGPHLFMAEFILHPENLAPSDGVDLFAGLSRWGAIGLTVPYDMMSAYDPDDNEQFAKLAGKALGEFSGSFMPQILHSFVDISAGVGGVPSGIASHRSGASIQGKDPAINFANEAFATFMRNFPYYKSIMMTTQNNPVDPKRGKIQDQIIAKAGPLSKITDAQFKQLMGQRLEHTSPIQDEFDALKYNFKGSKIGVPVFDNLVNRFVAKELTSKGGLGDIMKTPEYRGLGESARTELIQRYLYGPPGERGGIMFKSFAQVFLPMWNSGMTDGNPEARYLSLQALAAIMPVKRRDQIELLKRMGMSPGIKKKNLLSELAGLEQPILK
jgi:hypothetical protein